MPAKIWHDANKANIAVAKLATILKATANGVELGWGNESRIAFELLALYYNYSDEIPDHVRYQAARRSAVEAVADGSALTLAELEKRILMKVGEYRRLPNTTYVLRTSLSIDTKDALTSVRLPEAAISFHQRPPKDFHLNDDTRRHPPHRGEAPRNYTSVLVRLQGKDIESVGQAALKAVDYPRATWNFALNRGRFRIAVGDHPLNDILIGPLHTLHTADGTQIEHPVWYEPDYSGPARTFSFYSAKGLKNYEKKLLAAINRSPHGSSLREWLIRYGRALDDRNQNNCMLQMWALLEELTATPKGNHALTVQRAAFMAHDPTFHRLSLDYLRAWRNRIVHDGASAQSAELFTTEIRLYVEHLFLYLLNHSKHFATIQEFGSFLDTPPDPAKISRILNHLRLARKTRLVASAV